MPDKPLPLTPKPKQAVNNAIDVLNEKLDHQGNLINKLLIEATEKDNLLSEMENRLRRLEAEQIKTESLLFMKDVVSKHLSNRITQLEQYSRRYSVIVKGVPYENKEKFASLKETVNKIIENCDSETSVDDIDKFHRNGRPEDGKQDIIIRFKSHSAKESFYKNRKSIQQPARIKIQPSLSTDRKKLLNVANDLISKFKTNGNGPDFALPDVHGNLLVKFAKPTVTGLFLRFDSLEQLIYLIHKHDGLSEARKEFDELMHLSDSDDDDEASVKFGQSNLFS